MKFIITTLVTNSVRRADVGLHEIVKLHEK